MRQPSRCEEKVLYGTLSVLGISLWFLLGFPFANHNESYIWVVQLDQSGLLDVLSGGLDPVSTLRPLGLATAWAGYNLSGGSIYPQQVFNYAVALLAWLMLFSAMKEKRLFAWTSLLAGGAFFSGYLYLFHLHGVFYSPLLLFVACLLATAVSDRGLSARGLGLISVLAAVVSLYHPFALPLYIFYMLGHLLESRRVITPRRLVAFCLLLVGALVLMRVLVPGTAVPASVRRVVGAVTSYRTVELNPVVSGVALLLCLVATLSMKSSRMTRAVLGAGIVALSAIFVRLGLPVLMAWIALSFIKAAGLGRWRLALLVGVAAVLPAVTAIGSPTYTVFVIMIACAILPLGLRLPSKRLAVLDGLALAVVISIVVAGGALRAGVRLPVISDLAVPLRAEREKTFQLEEIIRWWLASDYRDARLVLHQSALNPVESAGAIDRTRRAPTSQDHLDAYTSYKSGREPVAGRLLVCFGGEKIEAADTIRVVPGEYNGNAIVYKPGS